jgi:hypothetical protein
MILLVSDMQDSRRIQTDRLGDHSGAKLDKGRGPVATVLVMNARSRKLLYRRRGRGKVRAMFNHLRNPLNGTLSSD